MITEAGVEAVDSPGELPQLPVYATIDAVDLLEPVAEAYGYRFVGSQLPDDNYILFDQVWGAVLVRIRRGGFTETLIVSKPVAVQLFKGLLESGRQVYVLVATTPYRRRRARYPPAPAASASVPGASR